MDLKPRAKAHPYLFFTEADLPALKDRAHSSPHAACYRLLLDTATRLVREPIPEEPALPSSPADEPRLQRRRHAVGRALQNCGQVFVFAYALSREPRYAARARDWALTCAGWPSWRRTAADLPAAHYLLGTSLIYDGLGDFLSDAERQILRRFLIDRLAAFHHRWQADSADSLAAPDSATWICLAAAGLGSLALLHEEEKAPSWAADWAQRFESWLLPASFGDQGEFLAGGDWRALDALRHGLLFLDALGNCSGPDLFLAPGLQAFPDFLRQSSEVFDLGGGTATPSWSLFPPPSPFHYRYVLLRLAAADRTGEPFQPAICQDLEVPRGVPLEEFYPDLHRISCAPDRWYTISLSWDAATESCRLGIDQQNWEFPLSGQTALERVDGVCFTGPDFDLRHLGVRAGQAPATVLLEQQTELRVADRPPSPLAAPSLQVPELRIGFPAATQGMVWFQLRKPDAQGRVNVRLLCAGRPGPGLQLAPVAAADGPGVEFLRLASDGQTAPPGGWCGGQIWFDAPWEYLWCDPERTSPRAVPRRAVHFAAAGLAFLRAAAGEPELRICAGQAEDWPNSVALRVDGETLIGAAPRAAGTNYPQFPERPPPVSIGGIVSGPSRSGFQSAISSGRIAHFFSSPAFAAVAGEAGQIYPDLRGFRRRVVYIKPDYFVLADDFEIDGRDSGRQLDWHLPIAGKPSLEDGCFRVQGGHGALEVRLLRPVVRLDEWADAIRLSLEPKAGKADLLALFVPFREGHRPAFRSEAIAARGGHGLRLARGSAVDIVLFRDAERDSLSAEGLRSDADLCFARRSGRSAPSLYALVQGTHLQARTELARTSEPADLFVHQTATRLSVSVQTRAALELRLTTGAPPRVVRLDSAPLTADAFNYVAQGRRLVLKIPSGVHQLDVILK